MRFLVAVALFLIAIKGSAQLHPTDAAKKLRASVMPLKQRNKLAASLLETAEKEAAALDEVDRALVLYRVAGGWMPLDPEHSIALYRQAFLASLHTDGAFRPALQHMILDEAVPLAPITVLELASQADKETQQTLYRAVLMYALMSTDSKLAEQAFEAAVNNQAVTGRMAATVLANFAPVERTQAFRALTLFYSQHPPSNGSWTFSGLVSQFYPSLPSQDVLAAIEIILQRATNYELEHPGGQQNMSSSANNISFRKETDLQLFAVAPALQKLHPAQAATLLRDNPIVAQWLIKYPEGLESFDQNHSFHGGVVVQPSSMVPKDLLTFSSAKASESLPLTQTDYGLEFTRADFPHYIQPTGSDLFDMFAKRASPEYAAYRAVIDLPQPDVLSAVDSVPITGKVPTTCSGPGGKWCSYSETYPQSELVRNLADHWTYAGKENNARAALRILPLALEKIPPQKHCTPLADAADLYLRMGDRSAAYTAIRTGLSAAAQAVTSEATAIESPWHNYCDPPQAVTRHSSLRELTQSTTLYIKQSILFKILRCAPSPRRL